MKRRDVLKLLSLGAAGLTGGFFTIQFFSKEAPAIVFLTDQPTTDLFYVLKQLKQYSDYRISEQPISPVPQDATLFLHGKLTDPFVDGTPHWFKTFTHQLRSRKRPATALIALEPETDVRKESIIIKSNGQIVDVLEVSRNYADIIVPGQLGKTHLSLQDGTISVTRASCKHKLCQKQGAISEGHLICAPNRLVVSLPRPSKFDALIG